MTMMMMIMIIIIITIMVIRFCQRGERVVSNPQSPCSIRQQIPEYTIFAPNRKNRVVTKVSVESWREERLCI